MKWKMLQNFRAEIVWTDRGGTCINFEFQNILYSRLDPILLSRKISKSLDDEIHREDEISLELRTLL